MNEIIKLEELISKEEIKNPEIFDTLKIIKEKFLTEIYLKNSLNSFIIEKGLSNDYYDHFRYEYAMNNLDEFKDTSIYPEYLKALVECNNFTRLRNILEKVEELEKINELEKNY